MGGMTGAFGLVWKTFRFCEDTRWLTWLAQCADRVLDGPASEQKGSKGRNQPGILSVKQDTVLTRRAKLSVCEDN